MLLVLVSRVEGVPKEEGVLVLEEEQQEEYECQRHGFKSRSMLGDVGGIYRFAFCSALVRAPTAPSVASRGRNGLRGAMVATRALRGAAEAVWPRVGLRRPCVVVGRGCGRAY